MAGSAILDPNVLIDDLVPDVDQLRDDLNTDFGTRAFRVYTVRRHWNGRAVGDGTFTDTVVQLTPQPRVWVWDGLRYQLEACGLNDGGEIKLTEVSLTYTNDELEGSGLGRADQWMIRIDEAHGQGVRTRYYVHAKPPFPDREQDIGWILWLRNVEVPGCG